MKNIMQLMQKAQQLQKDMENLKLDARSKDFTGSSGGGIVRVTLNGAFDIKAIEIDDSIIKPDEKTLITDLIIAAYNDAKVKANQYTEEKTKELTAGLPLPPGMKIPGMF